MKINLKSLMAASFVFIILSTMSAPAQKLEYMGSTLWGHINDIKISGNYAYAAFVNGLGIFDISDKTAPKLVSQLYIQGTEEGIALSGDYAYLGDGYSGLITVKITDPFNPKFVAACSLGVYTRGLFIRGNYKCAAGNGLQIIDISKPDSIYIIGSIKTPGQQSFNVIVRDKYAYLADENGGLQIINIEAPSKPVLTAGLNTYGWTYGLAISGNYIYAAEGFVGGFVGLQAINISDPEKPTSVDSCWTRGWASTVAIAGNYAYVPEVSTGGPASLAVINISDPSNMILSRAPDTISEASGSSIVGNYLYITGSKDWAYGFNIFDIKDKARPKRIGIYETYQVSGLYADSNYCYVGYDGLKVIDITNPKSMRIISSYPYQYDPDDIYKSRDNIYTISVDDLFVVNISDVSQPSLVRNLSLYHLPNTVTDLGNGAFITQAFNGLSIFNVGGRGQSETNNRELRNKPVRLFLTTIIAGNYAYVADYDFGLKIVDISDPGKPILVSSLQTVYSRDDLGPLAVYASGNYVYLLVWNSGLLIIDVSNPSKPVSVGAYQNVFRGTDVFVSDEYAYFTDVSGLHIIDVSDPHNPVKVADFDAGYPCTRVFVVGDNIYLASESALFALKLVP